MKYFLVRIQSRPFYYALAIGLIFAMMQFYLVGYPARNSELSMYMSVLPTYTFNPITIVFVLILPLLSAIPSATIYLQDQENCLYQQFLMKKKKGSYFFNLYLINFFTGFIVAFLPLVLNFLLNYGGLSHNKPHQIINGNTTIRLGEALLPKLFFNHPFINLLITSLMIAVFSGLCSNVAFALSLYIKNKIFIIVSAFFLQLILVFLNLTMFKQVSFAPAFFLTTAPWQLPTNLGLALIVLVSYLLLPLLLILVGVTRNESY